MKEIRVLATSMLGYGIPKEAFINGLNKQPDFIGSDMGSTDLGPYYLGSGEMGVSPLTLKRDLELVIINGLKKGIPVIMGSAGTAGAEPHLNQVLKIVKEIAKENNLNFKLGIINSELNKDFVKSELKKDKLKSCGPKTLLNLKEIDESAHIVAQIGPEPFIKALEKGAQVVLAGRSCDTSIFAAIPLMKGFNRGLTMHMSKIIECASQCAEPGGRDAIMGYLREDHFLLDSQNPKRRCTCKSIAAHSLYEQVDPYYLLEPGGTIDLSEATYDQYNDRITKVTGSRWRPCDIYNVKIEGACKIGYRAFAIGGVRDPIMIPQMDIITEEIRKIVRNILEKYNYGDDYTVDFRIYGKNGVMGDLEPQKMINSHELFVIIDSIAKNQELAKDVCAIARQNLLHYFYEGILATGGNIAVPFTPMEFNAGVVYKFNIYHLLEIEDSCELFPTNIIQIGSEKNEIKRNN